METKLKMGRHAPMAHGTVTAVQVEVGDKMISSVIAVHLL